MTIGARTLPADVKQGFGNVSSQENSQIALRVRFNLLFQAQATAFATALVCLVGSLLVATPSYAAPEDYEFDTYFTADGPHAIQEDEYKLPAQRYEDVLADRKTELWASVYAPTTEGQFPLVIFKHGNHASCGSGQHPRIDSGTTYTTQGTCRPHEVVVPNHRGYDYIARHLASLGYVVVSINSNRGITPGRGTSGDQGLNKARGRLILKHMEWLAEMNRTPSGSLQHLGFDLYDKIDFGNVGMMGHSRGGEGVRAAYNFYYEAGSDWPQKIGEELGIKALYEIGPVDGQTNTIFNAEDVAWTVLIPKCDGDVSNQAGIRVYDRMMHEMDEHVSLQKSVFSVWGANHNFFNTEWQQTDARGPCAGHEKLTDDRAGKIKQMTIGRESIVSFFTGHVGATATPGNLQMFNPSIDISSLESITRLERAYNHGTAAVRSKVLESFNNPTNGITDSGLEMARSANVDLVHRSPSNHDRVRKMLHIKAGANTNPARVKIPLGDGLQGLNFLAWETLDLDIGKEFDNRDEIGETKVYLTIEDTLGAQSNEILLNDYADIINPVGYRGRVLTLRTARIPVSAIVNVKLDQVSAMMLSIHDLDESAGGAAQTIIIDDIRLSDTVDYVSDFSKISFVDGNASYLLSEEIIAEYLYGQAGDSRVRPLMVNRDYLVQRSGYAMASPEMGSLENLEKATWQQIDELGQTASSSDITLVVTTQEPLPVTGSLPELVADDITLKSGNLSGSDMRKVEFVIPADVWQEMLARGATEQFIVKVGHRIIDVRSAE